MSGSLGESHSMNLFRCFGSKILTIKTIIPTINGRDYCFYAVLYSIMTVETSPSRAEMPLIGVGQSPGVKKQLAAIMR